MINALSIARVTFALGLSGMMVFSVGAATYCVGPSATGNGSGTNWSNLKAWSSTPVRGDTWYLAGGLGNYASKSFSTPNSGSTAIVIKKAIASDHYTDSGWTSTYANQAVIYGSLSFTTDYWIFNGQTRNEDDWFDVSAYGIQIQQPSGNYSSSITYWSSYSTISYVGINANVVTATTPSTTVGDYQINWYSGGSYPINVQANVSHCLVQGGNNHFYMRWCRQCTLEYSASTGLSGNAANHAECVNWYGCFGVCDTLTVRYCKFYNNTSTSGTTAMIAICGPAPNCSIYGNIFYNCACGDGMIGWNGTASGIQNLKIYNNTIIGHVGNWPTGIVLDTASSGCVAYNNIWYDANTPNFVTVSHDYNACNVNLGEAHSQILSSSGLFFNYAAGDFRLTADTATGLTLPSPYDTDMLGTARGASGAWSRGAYQYTTVSTNPVMSVTPASLNFGSVVTNTASQFTATVKNIGGGTLAYTANVAAPFYILSGGTNSLSANQSQTVTLQYRPTVVGANAQVATFNGGGGATINLTGVAVTLAARAEAPLPPQNLSVIATR